MRTILTNLPAILALAAALLSPALAETAFTLTNTITLDTRDGSRPVVQDVTSAYCGAGRHACFLHGVALGQTFTASVNWNGKTPGSIQFIGPWGTHVQSGTQLSRAYNVGADFGVGGKLRVKVLAGDGTESLEYPVNFDVASRPPMVGSVMYLSALSGQLGYRTPAIDLEVFKGRSGVTSGVPLPGETMEVAPKFEAEAKIDSAGLLTISAMGGRNNSIKLNGTQGRRPDGKFGKAAGVDFGFGVQGDLVARWNATAANWDVVDGNLGLNAYGAYSTAPYYVYAPPPIYLRADIAGELFFGVNVLSLLPSDEWNPQFVLSTEAFPEITGVLGCGVSGILAVEGYVGLKGKFDFSGPPVVCDRLGIGGRVGARLVVIGFGSAPIDIWSGDYWIINNGTATASPPPTLDEGWKTALRKINTVDAEAFKPLPRGYLEKPYALFNAPKSQKSPRSPRGPLEPGGGSVTALQENVYPYSEPSLSAAAGSRMLLWIWDDPGRSAENRTELVWSRWDGGAWSEPAAVWDDGTADFAPEVKLLPDGTALAVATNGKALLTWIANEDNSVLGATGMPNAVHSRLWNGSSWDDPGDPAAEVPMLLWSTVAFNGVNGVFLAAVDGDDDQSTTENQELWGATFNGTAWGTFTRLTTNTEQDTKPQAVYDSSGKLLVAWSRGNHIVVHSGDLNLGNPTVVGTLGGALAQQDFELVTGPAGQVSMVWQDLAGDGTGSDPFLLNYDATLEVWSEPTRLLTNNTNQLERSFSPAYGDNGALLMAYDRIDVTPDAFGVPEFGQVDLMVLNYLIGSDLAVLDGDISLMSDAVPGQSVEIAAILRNLGELAATTVTVAFYDGDPGSGGTQIGATQTVQGTLAAGATATVQVAWTVPDTQSSRTIHVVVDPKLALEDRTRTNNSATLSVLSPDLQISGMRAVQPGGTSRIIYAACLNAGTIPAGSPVDVSFRRGSPTGPVIATIPISALPSDGTFEASFEWDMAGSTFTSAYEMVHATVDAGEAVAEADEGNNTAWVSVMTSLDSDGDGLLDGEEALFGTRVDVADSDGDGLMDGQEVHTCGTAPLVADSDGDGMEDGAEVQAGTDPNSSADVFAVKEFDASTGQARVRWTAKAGKTYQVEKSSDLLIWTDAPTGLGTDEQSQKTALGDGILLYVDPDPMAGGRSFYRVRVGNP